MTYGEWIPIKRTPMDDDERKEWSEKLGYELDDEDAYIYSNLPDDGQRVLVWHDWSHEIEIDTFCDEGEGCYFEENGEMAGITAWMPLPKPFVEGENNETDRCRRIYGETIEAISVWSAET